MLAASVHSVRCGESIGAPLGLMGVILADHVVAPLTRYAVSHQTPLRRESVGEQSQSPKACAVFARPSRPWKHWRFSVTPAALAIRFAPPHDQGLKLAAGCHHLSAVCLSSFDWTLIARRQRPQTRVITVPCDGAGAIIQGKNGRFNVRLGTQIRLADGREGTAVFNGLSGVGIKWGLHDPDPADFKGTADDCFGRQPNPDWPWRPDAMLRDSGMTESLGVECVGEDYEIIREEYEF